MRAIHPSEVLREEFLIPLGLSASALAIAFAVPAPRINDVVRERCGVTPDTAVRLAAYFSNTAEFWPGLQMDYDPAISRKALHPALKRVAPRKALAA